MTTRKIRYSELGTRDAGPPSRAERGSATREPERPANAEAGRAAPEARPSAEATAAPAAVAPEPALLLPDEAPVAPRVARTLRLRGELRGGSVELLLFRVGAELFGLELDAVEEVLDLPELHRVPEMPENVLGVFALRGTLVPLYTPDASLGASLRDPVSALVFRTGARRLALAVDDVDDVLTLPLPALRDVPVTDAGDGVLAGVARRERDLIGVLDVEALLAQLRAAHALEPL